MSSSPVPRTLDEFARLYTSFIRGLGHRCGVPVDALDDFAQDVLLWVCERNELSAFDPAIAKFTTWLGGLVQKRSMSFITTHTRQRNELTLNAPVSAEDGASERGDLVPDTTDDYARASSARSIVEFHRDLERTDPDRAKLLTVLVAELAEPQAHDYMATNDVRRINRRRVARKAGVTASRLNDQLDLLGRSAIRSGFAA